MKAFKSDTNEIYMFRPDMNMRRMNVSAERLSLPVFLFNLKKNFSFKFFLIL